MSDPQANLFAELLGLELPPERLREVLSAYGDILGEIRRLRTLDLTDVHPAIVFEPSAPYRNTP
jgi:hypothetical protein